MTVTLERYEERFIAFIDILGFKEHISQTLTNSTHFKKVRNVLNFISKLKYDNDGGVLAQKEIGREITVFSDSIVISYPISLPSAGFYLLLDVIHLQLEMMGAGILMRGGITIGPLCHEDNIVYGPAMIKAYELENQYAIYPRVIVDKEAIKSAILEGHHPPKEELEYIKKLIKKDIDEHYFVDFMSQWQEIEYEHDYFTALDTIKVVIVQALSDYIQVPNVLQKYTWLKNYYNNVLDKLNPQYTQERYIP
ncbi:hypothetical protein [Bacillus cereus]|uniref:hypothetical protein n=1 Tax=Bacillus cereus TaxID=1396 RepID=UPI001495C0A5|nr:hypothetical protein [Bacillus cereus]QKE10617.1 hypothetical protein HPG46_27640 [Bacillus cereus]